MDKEISKRLEREISLKKLDKKIYSKRKIKKYIKQRAKKGYSDLDLWNLDSYLSNILYNALKVFIKRNASYPGTEEFPTFDSWQEYLTGIVEDLDYYYTYKEKYGSSVDNYDKAKLEEAYDYFDDAWSRLGKVFHRLWI